MRIVILLLLLLHIQVVGQGVCIADHALTSAAAPDSFTIPPPPKRCEDGPLRVNAIILR